MPSHGKGMLLTPLRFRRTYLSRALIILAVFFAVSGLVASVAVPGPREEPGQPGSQSGRILDPTNTVTTLDREHGAGRFPSVAIGSDGLGLISYFDETKADLKVAHCLDISCTAADLTTLDNTGGSFTSITIGSDGFALVSYMDMPDGGIKVAHCLDLECTEAELTTLGSTLGEYSSITIGPAGLGLIAVRDGANMSLKVAYCSNAACSEAVLATVDDAGHVGAYPSIAVGSDGFGLVAYYDETNNNLKVAHLGNPSSAHPSAIP